jgi:hypothetical protein
MHFIGLGIYGVLPNLEEISSKEGVHWQEEIPREDDIRGRKEVNSRIYFFFYFYHAALFNLDGRSAI